ncbi:CBR-PAN-1 protein [Aphelenchoides avenae]|nr:CBR-PAN-1 protein [Aphelenchus avenae]
MKHCIDLLILLLGTSFVCATEDHCADIERAIQDVTEAGEKPVCRCLPEFGSLEGRESDDDPAENVWIGCTGQNMPSVFRALNSVNETLVAHLQIWNSLINILPNDMFAKVRPRVLTIENSGVSVFRKGAFSNIGRRLKSLHLKNNILKTIERRTFADLRGLRTLDLSLNKVKNLKKGQFDELPLLESLRLANNQISSIEDGTFENLSSLKSLNLAHNKITNITRDTFRGLNNLEVLDLQGNLLHTVDWSAFSHMKHLRRLDLSTNALEKVELRGHPDLERIYLNNNNLASLQNVSLRDLPAIEVLTLDRNQITVIGGNDFSSLSQSRHMKSLSLSGNKISTIDADAFKPLGSLAVLSLQDNQISSLSGVTAVRTPALKPLANLRSLFLSKNKLTAIEDGEVNTLSKLRELVLDHNEITLIHKNALSGLQLNKFFVNNNKLYYLPDGIFDGWNKDQIIAVDISDNPWECICGREWIGKWLVSLGAAHVPSGDLGCLSLTCDRSTDDNTTQRTWITIVASILAFVVLLLLVAIGYLYMQENCYAPPMPLKRVPSDMMRLIPSTESLSFPNPVSQPMYKNKVEPIRLPPTALKTVDAAALADRGVTGGTTTQSEDASGAKSEKRVRFDGV